jgi:hypothetical protein
MALAAAAVSRLGVEVVRGLTMPLRRFEGCFHGGDVEARGCSLADFAMPTTTGRLSRCFLLDKRLMECAK